MFYMFAQNDIIIVVYTTTLKNMYCIEKNFGE